MTRLTRLIRLLALTLFLFLLLSIPASAADIVIPATTMTNWQKPAPVVYIFYSTSFTAADGEVIPAGNAQNKNAYLRVVTTKIGTTLTIPSHTIKSTRDGLDSTTSRVSYVMFTTAGAEITPNPLAPYTNLAIPATLTSASGCSPMGTCGTLAELKNLQSGLPPVPPPFYYTQAEIDRLFDAITAGVSAAIPVITKTPDSELTNEFALSTLATGILKNTTTTGIPTIAIAGTDYLAPNGSGAALTALNATQLTSGTIPDARFPATLPALNGSLLTALNASNLGSGTVPDARFPATLPATSGVNLTALNATQLTSGTIPIARGQEVWGLVDLSDVTAKKGNSTVVQMQLGATATDDCAKFDVNGNLVSTGSPCGSGAGSGTVTSVGMSVPAFLTLGASPNPITGSGVFALALSGTALPITSGGTGSTTQNFVDLTTGQSVAGAKTFSGAGVFSTSLDAIILNSTLAGLPAVATSGKLRYLSDSLRGPAFDTGTNWYRALPEMNVQAWGARFDGKLVGDAACTNTSTTITSGSANFTSADVGKTFAADGCGVAGATLTGTISAVGGVSSITVSAAASTTASPTNLYYGTDDTAEIQAAIDAAPATGAVLVLPAGKAIISATLTIGDGGPVISSLNNLHIKGQGGGRTQIGYQGGATELWWVHASSTNPMVKILGPYTNPELSGIFFDAKVGPGGAASAIQCLWCHKGIFDDLSIIGHSGWGLDFDTVASPVAGAGVGGDDNRISNIWVGAPSANVADAGGLRLGGADTTSGATSRNQIINASFYSSSHTDSAAINLRFGDANSFYGVTTHIQGSAEGLLITAAPSNSAYPAATAFYNSALVGGTRVSGTWGPQGKISFWPYSVADGAPIPTAAGLAGVTDGNVTDNPTFFGAFTFRDVTTFQTNPIITNAAPGLVFTDTTGSAKSLTVAVDADKADFRESAGGTASLLQLNLTTNRVGIGITPATTLHVFSPTASETQFRIEGQDNPRLDFYTTAGNAASRNWSLRTDTTAFGDLALSTSATQGGDGFTGAVRRFYISPAGGTVLGSPSPLASNATDGFVYLPTSTTFPTGTPSTTGAFANMAPIQYDLGDGLLVVYSSSAAAWYGVGGRTVRAAANFTKTSDTTLANVTNLSHNVAAGRKYAFRAVLYTTSDAAGGVKFAIAGTATATSVTYEAVAHSGGALNVITTSRASALATAVGQVTAVTVAQCIIEGTIDVNAAGTLTVQFAQNASSGVASTILANSTFQITQSVN